MHVCSRRSLLVGDLHAATPDSAAMQLTWEYFVAPTSRKHVSGGASGCGLRGVALMGLI